MPEHSAAVTYSPTQNFDWLFRVYKSDNSIEKYEIQWLGNTSAYRLRAQNVLVQNAILWKVARNLWKNHLYSSEYMAFLLGNYTKQEFIEVAKKYAEPYDSEVSNEMLSYAAYLLPNVVGSEIEITDLSVMLNVDNKAISEVCEIQASSESEILGK